MNILGKRFATPSFVFVDQKDTVLQFGCFATRSFVYVDHEYTVLQFRKRFATRSFVFVDLELSFTVPII